MGRRHHWPVHDCRTVRSLENQGRTQAHQELEASLLYAVVLLSSVIAFTPKILRLLFNFIVLFVVVGVTAVIVFVVVMAVF